MQITFDYQTLQPAIEGTLFDFKEQVDVNQLIIDLRTILFAAIEELITAAIQKLLYDPCFLKTLKQLAATSGLRFKGFKPTSIRLLSGRALPIESPYFAKTPAHVSPRSQAQKAPDQKRLPSWAGIRGLCRSLQRGSGISCRTGKLAVPVLRDR